MKATSIIFAIASIIVTSNVLLAQNTVGFSEVSNEFLKQLRESLDELAALEQAIADEKLPLSRQLSQAETELIEVRQKSQQLSRKLDQARLGSSEIQKEIKSRRDVESYLGNLLSEYIRNVESRLHIAELQRYREKIEHARLASENTNMSPVEVLRTKADALILSLDRLEDVVSGTSFEASAVNPAGLVVPGKAVLVGPAAIFRAHDGSIVGTLEQRLGSLDPAIIPFDLPDDADAASTLIVNGSGTFPFDTTLGNAHKVASTKETIWEHIQKGGPVVVPIFALAGAAFLIVVYKWLTLSFVRSPSQSRIRALLEAVSRRDKQAALQAAQRVPGPAGTMLRAGVEHLEEPRSLIEEVMFEKVLTTKLKLNRLLPFVAISAAAAPLLGLLGTVTGIMNTFTLITVFGTGDVKTLSSGISEALITTELGLVVAIPSLLLHAVLSRRARGIIDRMEKAALAFLNQVGKTPLHVEQSKTDQPAATEILGHRATQQVRDILIDVLGPVLRDRPRDKSTVERDGKPEPHDSRHSPSAAAAATS